MRRKQGKNLGVNDKKNNVYITVGIIIIAVVTFILSYVLYGNKLSQQAKVNNNNSERVISSKNSMLNIVSNMESSQTSKSIGKSVNEQENSTVKTNVQNMVEDRAINTSAIEKKVVSERNKNTENTQTTSEEEKQGDNNQDANITFIKPVDGNIIKDFASDTLIYSNTLEEWTTHMGVDYAAEKTSIVKAAADGVIKSIKNDPRYGLTVVIEHENGFTSLYANLLSTEFITVGEKVTQGQTIATIGNTATFEIADETHLHFEISKDGTSVDPNLYVK